MIQFLFLHLLWTPLEMMLLNSSMKSLGNRLDFEFLRELFFGSQDYYVTFSKFKVPEACKNLLSRVKVHCLS